MSIIGQGVSTGIQFVGIGSREFYERSDCIEFGVSLGLTFIDTAENYGNGISEELIGFAVRNVRETVQIASKFSPENSSFKSVIKSAENTLRRLKTDYLDLYQFHWPNYNVDMSETLSALFKLKSEGKIKEIGVSNFSKKQLQNLIKIAGERQIFSNQVEYNIFDRFIEDQILPYCIEKKLKIIAYSPLDKGRVLPAGPEFDSLKIIANKYNITTQQLALCWVINNSNLIAIPSTTSKAHLKENADCMNITIEQNDLVTISNFNCQPQFILPSIINVSESGENNKSVYKTLEQAKLNRQNFCPSPVTLSKEIIQDDIIKPVRLVRSVQSDGQVKYDLIEGRVRYWAWVLAFGYDRPIPAYIRNSKQ